MDKPFAFSPTRPLRIKGTSRLTTDLFRIQAVSPFPEPGDTEELKPAI
jgi:hypothetical protein